MIEIKGGKIILNSNTSDNKYALEISIINLTSENGKTLIWFKLDDSIKCIETKESFDDILEAISEYKKNKIYKCANENGHFRR